MPSQEHKRTCVGCRRRAQREELIRFVGRGAEWLPDLARTLPGRGAHACPTRRCLELGVERGGFTRTLRRRIRVEDLGAFIAGLETAMQEHLLASRAGLSRAGVLNDDEDAGTDMPAWKRRLQVLESAVAAFATGDEGLGK